jgi:hypothetical protein
MEECSGPDEHFKKIALFKRVKKLEAQLVMDIL